MSYNPVAAANFRKNGNKRRRAYDPHSGTKHSDIMRRAGSPLAIQDRTQTRHGFTTSVFNCDDFTVRHESLSAGNNLGLGVNYDADRVILVKRGSVFVTEIWVSGNESEPRLRELREGQFFQAQRGTKHSIATSGTADAEVYFIESANYLATWEALDESVAKAIPTTILQTPLESVPARRADNSKAKEQAATMGRRKAKKLSSSQHNPVARAAAENTNSSTIIGVNPRPMGPPQGD